MRLNYRFFAIFVVISLVASHQIVAHAQEVKTVSSVDLNRYLGKWYEIARFPNRFQAKCSGNVTAEYALKADGQISVTNACKTAEGTIDSAKGTAIVKDENSHAKLKVRFAPDWLAWLPLVWGDYWIIDLAPDYSYSVVGEPGREYLWILSRSPNMPDSIYQEAVVRATAQGFDTARLVKTPQD